MTNVNTAVVVTVLANDRDTDGDVVLVASLTEPCNGAASLNADGTITYTPNSGYTGVGLRFMLSIPFNPCAFIAQTPVPLKRMIPEKDHLVGVGASLLWSTHPQSDYVICEHLAECMRKSSSPSLPQC